jgi:DNA-directed RNA polymerase subunit M/transcription elongation factor TFIIS
MDCFLAAKVLPKFSPTSVSIQDQATEFIIGLSHKSKQHNTKQNVGSVFDKEIFFPTHKDNHSPKCKHCGKVVTFQMKQLRLGGDEGMTTIFICTSCNIEV